MTNVLKSAALVAAGLLLISETAQPTYAFGFGRRYHSCGSYGSCGSSGGSSGSWGSRGSCGSRGSSGSWGSCGSSGGWHSSGGSSGSWGSYGSSGSSGGHPPVYHAPVDQSAPINPAPAAPAPATQSSISRPVDTRATIRMNVPADAVVYLMDQKMTLTGPARRFSIPMPSATQTYEYTVRIEVTNDGKKSEAVTSLKLKAGVNVQINVAKNENNQLVTVAKK